MDKVLLTDIRCLELRHVDSALRVLKEQGYGPPYSVKIGPFVKLGDGVKQYLDGKEVVIR